MTGLPGGSVRSSRAVTAPDNVGAAWLGIEPGRVGGLTDDQLTTAPAVMSGMVPPRTTSCPTVAKGPPPLQ